jgi:alkanesulfonate monooxygenase SsuD/methylene tetrahydromethanopterin reductase-like flavin-dependent oxidoreductase (luciferase family)
VPAGRLEAGVRAAFLSQRTRRVGLAPTLHVTTTEPFHLATQLASLDHATRGRAGWVVGAENSAAALAGIGATPLGEPDALRQEVGDVIDVVRLLWDSWEDDAVIKDRATGRFLDPDRVHHVNFAGASFSVTGPLITPRPPQGQVVVLGADTLGVTGRLDVALIDAPDLDEIAVRARRAREAGAALVFAELDLLLDAGEPAGRPHRLRHTGSATGLLQLLEQLAQVVDGVRIHPTVLSTDLPVLAEHVVPQFAGATGASLRETLGLPRPVNHFATA